MQEIFLFADNLTFDDLYLDDLCLGEFFKTITNEKDYIEFPIKGLGDVVFYANLVTLKRYKATYLKSTENIIPAMWIKGSDYVMNRFPNHIILEDDQDSLLVYSEEKERSEFLKLAGPNLKAMMLHYKRFSSELTRQFLTRLHSPKPLFIDNDMGSNDDEGGFIGSKEDFLKNFEYNLP